MEANFSESQLQQAVNTSLVFFISQETGEHPFVHVPSLFYEKELGWDSALYLPWLESYAPHEKHEGCNFFIQYKLSELLTTTSAREWGCWGGKYFRFCIPHFTIGEKEKYIDDYHQWDCLKKLADDGYPTYYATNSTLNKNELIKSYNSGKLIHETPFLDVRKIHMKHKHVTFTKDSSYFKLHSEIEQTERARLETEIKMAMDDTTYSLTEFISGLSHLLREIGGDNKLWHDDLFNIRKMDNNNIPKSLRTWRQYLLLTSFVRKHIGAEMIWIPKK
ncbi:hypothetical protein ABRZ24_18860 [Brenneria populi]|uniref:Uncharacterized protein n=1 Tax=Brenneria populi TaxID=1505588 RepID=A0ABU6JVX4_9GAMM|nr:hypothetical protein [Brenneria populi Li et al. 2015]